jgi:hypothetical protein
MDDHMEKWPMLFDIHLVEKKTDYKGDSLCKRDQLNHGEQS